MPNLNCQIACGESTLKVENCSSLADLSSADRVQVERVWSALEWYGTTRTDRHFKITVRSDGKQTICDIRLVAGNVSVPLAVREPLVVAAPVVRALEANETL